jgi:hypothetical protein
MIGGSERKGRKEIIKLILEKTGIRVKCIVLWVQKTQFLVVLSNKNLNNAPICLSSTYSPNSTSPTNSSSTTFTSPSQHTAQPTGINIQVISAIHKLDLNHKPIATIR